MSMQLRKLISTKINELTSMKGSVAGLLELKLSKQGQIDLKLPYLKELRDLSNDWTNSINHDLIAQVAVNKTDISFALHQQAFIEETFKDPTNLLIDDKPKTFIVEFSSPNIAKPFHMGHLRSTIIGSFLSNLLTRVNNKVIKMNYLGDYGTQFGFLKVGIDMEQLSDEEIKMRPLESLLKAYVTANTSSDPSVAEKARKVFEVMENSENVKVIQQWEQIKRYTMDELNVMYERLNVVFDVYEFESMYRKTEVDNLIAQMKERNLLLEDDGKMVVEVGDRRVPIVKSDSTTLYLTRDIAAFVARKERYKMDKILYVVDNGQSDHFKAIKSIVGNLGYDSENVIQHIKFGRIRGMSTRKGTAVFLKDILEEAKEKMMKKQQESATTKVDISANDSTADVLGSSAVIVNDLKQRRQRDYEFDWNKVLQVNGDTGVKLQYTHCRLFNLNRLCGVTEADSIDLQVLKEPEAQRLIFEISRYPETIYNCVESLEACGLVNYLFVLCNSASRALKMLNVKNCDDKYVASQRLLLFNTTRKVLKDGLEIIGLKALNEM